MIPNSIDISTEEATGEIALSSFTYALDFINGRIIGTVDRGNAMLQAIDKLLQTMRYSSVIYDWFYGNEFHTLLGKNYEYVVVEVPRIVEECLLQDDRITQVSNYKFEKLSIDSISISFLVSTIFGTIPYSMEVAI